ncbi:MAG: glycosyltransferase, partial [Methylococcales bacterium]|nr:glycosyltransferase [Methylococcales bacterium]
IEPERIGVIYNGVDLADIDQKAQAPLPATLRWPENTAKFVAVGRLVPKKDYPTLLKAFAQLTQNHPSELIILGEGPERARLEALVRELAIKDQVQLPGRCDNPYAVLARADGYVLSSMSEGMPSALIEALACRCPVVSTRCPSGPEEILEQGQYGQLVPVGDVSALREAMRGILTDPMPGEELRRRAEQLSSAHAVRQYLQVIDSVLES